MQMGGGGSDSRQRIQKVQKSWDIMPHVFKGITNEKCQQSAVS